MAARRGRHLRLDVRYRRRPVVATGAAAAVAAGVVDFSGLNEEIRVATGTNDPTGAFTAAAIFRLDVIGQWHSLIAGHDAAGTAQWQMEVSTANHVSFGTSATTSTVDTLAASTWYLVAFSKPAGTGNTSY